MSTAHDTFGGGDGGGIAGRVGDSGHVWTARPTSTRDNNGFAVAAATSEFLLSESRLYSGSGSTRAALATVDTGETDFDAFVSFERVGNVFGGAGLVARWSASGWYYALLYRSGSGSYIAELARESTSARVSLVNVALDAGFGPQFAGVRMVGRGDRLELWLRDGLPIGSAPPSTPSPWTMLGVVDDGVLPATGAHGVLTYYAAAPGPLATSWGLDDFTAGPPTPLGGGWSIGVVE